MPWTPAIICPNPAWIFWVSAVKIPTSMLQPPCSTVMKLEKVARIPATMLSTPARNHSTLW